MPRVDTYGTQQPIALLHFLVGRGNLYDRGKDLHVKVTPSSTVLLSLLIVLLYSYSDSDFYSLISTLTLAP